MLLKGSVVDIRATRRRQESAKVQVMRFILGSVGVIIAAIVLPIGLGARSQKSQNEDEPNHRVESGGVPMVFHSPVLSLQAIPLPELTLVSCIMW